MRQFRTILLLFTLGIGFFPWQLVCTAHPFGHDHDPDEGPSPCELRRMYQGTNSALWPPMDCEHIYLITDDYQENLNETVLNNFSPLIFAILYFDLILVETPQENVLLPPDPKCRSATLLADCPLRAPPLS
ncbi:hypothetical protein [Aquiflexum sp.]|uniref:hypothetical protein n=1 Tax=Aquiflexum sp. TaxID=1872584 RepID=UPI0035939758